MTTNIDFESTMEKLVEEIKKKQGEIVALTQGVNDLITTLENSLKDFKTMKKLQTSPETFVSRLVNTTHINPIITASTSSVTLAEKLKYSGPCIEAFEKISKYYDYKSNNRILRNGKVSKYPRYICREDANPELVESLLNYGFMDKVIVDETFTSIAKLPSIIIQSVQVMTNSYGKGLYGVQIFDACTDLTGNPIIICQIFKIGKNTIIEGDSTSLKGEMPCKIEQFQDWLCTKRAIGLLTLKSKLEDMMKAGKACVLGTGKGAGVEEIITLYYNNDVLETDTTALQALYERIKGLKHRHAKETIEQYNKMISGQRRRPIITMGPTAIKEEGCSDPFN